VRVRMHFDQEPIGSSCDCGARHGWNLITKTDTVGWVGEDRQGRKFLDNRNLREIHWIAGISFEGANAALAEHHFVVASGEDVFRREQQLFNGGSDAAL